MYLDSPHVIEASHERPKCPLFPLSRATSCHTLLTSCWLKWSTGT